VEGGTGKVDWDVTCWKKTLSGKKRSVEVLEVVGERECRKKTRV